MVRSVFLLSLLLSLLLLTLFVYTHHINECQHKHYLQYSCCLSSQFTPAQRTVYKSSQSVWLKYLYLCFCARHNTKRRKCYAEEEETKTVAWAHNFYDFAEFSFGWCWCCWCYFFPFLFWALEMEENACTTNPNVLLFYSTLLYSTPPAFTPLMCEK